MWAPWVQGRQSFLGTQLRLVYELPSSDGSQPTVS